MSREEREALIARCGFDADTTGRRRFMIALEAYETALGVKPKKQIEILHPDGRIEVVDVDAMREEEAKAWDSLDPEIQRKAIDYLLTALPSFLKDKLRAKIAMGGDWPAFNELEGHAIPSPFHFNTGMRIRNGLREHVCTDDKLPTGNWDDVYVRAIEEALS